MAELANVQEAHDHVLAHYKLRSGGGLLERDFEDYARIAYFLSCRQDVAAAMRGVSERLWACDVFRDDGPGDRRFTSALVALAKGFGWEFGSPNEMVVLLGAVSGEQYEAWTRAGTFFKDDMDAKHGEHAHSLQWLAIALWRKHIKLQRAPDQLYRFVFDAMPKKSGTPSLWSWLVDCFPSSIGAAPVSDSFRSPQYVMQWLFDEAPEDLFLKQYMLKRYRKRHWIKDDGAYDGVSGGATLKNYKEAKIANAAAAWTSIGDKPGVAYVRSGAPTAAHRSHARTAHVFHGKSGYL